MTRRGAYTPKATKEYEEYVRLCYKQQCGDTYFGEKSISIFAIAYVTPLKKFKKSEKEAALKNETRPTSKPDTDNIMKGVLDALNAVAFADDRYIYELHIIKKYDSNPRVEVTISDE